MRYENAFIENFDSILLMEWKEKADSMISGDSLYKVISPFLEKDAIKTLAVLREAYGTILCKLPVGKRIEFERLCSDITKVKINGELYDLVDVGFFAKPHAIYGKSIGVLAVIFCLITIPLGRLYGLEPDSQGIQWYIHTRGYLNNGKWHAYYTVVDVSNTTGRAIKTITIPQKFPGYDHDVLDGIRIKSDAFLNCKGISEVVIPKVVDDIEEGALNCKESLLTNILVDARNEHYSSQNGLLLSKDGKKVIQGVNGTVIIPESVTEIGGSAFAYCTNLTSVYFTTTRPSVASYTSFYNVNQSCVCKVPFEGLWRYEDTIPGVWKGLHTDYTNRVVRFFLEGGSVDLDSDIIPTAPTNFVMLANNGLIDRLPTPQRDGYTFLGWFTQRSNGCEIISGLSLSESVRAYAHWAANGYVVSFDANGGVDAEQTLKVVYDFRYGQLPTVAREGYSFAGWCLNGTSVTENTIVKTARDHVLAATWTANCYSATYNPNGGSVSNSSKTVTFDSCYGQLAVPTRAGYSFAGWLLGDELVSADTVVITAGNHELVAQWTVNQYLVTFDTNGGEGGTSATMDYGTEIVAPTVIREGCTFEGWSPAVPVTVPASNSTYVAKWKVWSAVVDSTAKNMRAQYPKDYQNITNVTLSFGITEIPDGFFDGCNSLVSIVIPDSVTNVADYAFADCTNLQTEVQGGYKVMNGWVVGYTDEAEETIPDTDNLKGICSGALKGCTALKRLEFGDRARLVSIGAEALKGCTELKTLVLPPSLTRIGNEAFMGCSYLDDVIVPGGVKSVGARAFKNCTGFTYAQIEHGVESIGEEAFYGCWRITEVDIPSSVSSIGQNAFGGDSSITKVALRGDIRRVSQIFANYQSIREATVKAGSGSLVDGLFSGCSSLETVRFLGDCPALANNGANLYQNANWSLVTYVSKDSTGWDGTAGSHTLPMAWPLVGSYRRSITYADDISVPHAVAFDANGGTPKTQNVEQRSETPFVLPKEPTRAGYTFAGWWTEKNGGVKVTEGTVFIEGVYSYLYAHWLKPGQIVLEGVFSGTGKVSLDENDNIVVTLMNDVSGTVEIPDNVGAVTIDLNGHSMVGDGGPAIRIVKGDGEGAVATQGSGTTKLEIVDTSDGEKGQITGGGESAGIEIAEDAALRVRLDVEDDVSVFNGDGSEQDWRALSPVEFTLTAGESFKATLAELGYDVPTDGTAYNVVAKGLPAGLKLVSNKAVTKKVKQGGKTKTVVVKAAKSEWWIEGVPTAAVDFFTNPPYLVITANGETTTEALPVEVAAQEVTELEDLVLGQSINTNGWLAGVGAGWTVSGLPTGLKYATKKVTKTTGSGKKKVTTTVAEAYAVYGKTTKAGLFTVTAKKKANAQAARSTSGSSKTGSLPVYYETKKFRVLVRPKAVDTAVFGESLTNITTMAYVPVEWDLTGDGHAGRVTLPVVSNVVKVAGLPSGVTFAAKNTYKDKKKTQVKQYGQTIVGTPTKPGTYVVTFTKNVTTGTGKKRKTVAKTAQILWTVEPNDAGLDLGFNTAGGVVESGVVGLKYDGLMAFTAMSNATVTASGLPAGMKLSNLGNGQYAFTGFTTKAGTYLVTVKATLMGKTVTQRLALKVDGLPAWAKGTYNGNVKRKTGDGELGDGFFGLATVTVSAAGKISGKFYDGGTNWTFSATSYTGKADDAFFCTNAVAKYAYKVTKKVKEKGKTVTKTETKYVTRRFSLEVGNEEPWDGVRRGYAVATEQTGEDGVDGVTLLAWQNLWSSTYKDVGKALFSTQSGKTTLAYRTFTVKGTTDEGAGRATLPEGTTLTLKVTTAGAVTATLTYDTGKTAIDKKTGKKKTVYYKPACSSVVIPVSAPDAEEFAGEVLLYFAPSAANNFPGWSGVAPISLPVP